MGEDRELVMYCCQDKTQPERYHDFPWLFEMEVVSSTTSAGTVPTPDVWIFGFLLIFFNEALSQLLLSQRSEGGCRGNKTSRNTLFGAWITRKEMKIQYNTTLSRASPPIIASFMNNRCCLKDLHLEYQSRSVEFLISPHDTPTEHHQIFLLFHSNSDTVVTESLAETHFFLSIFVKRCLKTEISGVPAARFSGKFLNKLPIFCLLHIAHSFTPGCKLDGSKKSKVECCGNSTFLDRNSSYNSRATYLTVLTTHPVAPWFWESCALLAEVLLSLTSSFKTSPKHSRSVLTKFLVPNLFVAFFPSSQIK